MTRISVRLVDEDARAAKSWKRSLDEMILGRSKGEKKLDVRTFEVQDDLKPCVDTLMARRERSRKSTPKVGTEGDSRGIDNVDVFIIDYDLLGSGDGIQYTGEDLAYLVRCYSSCKVIVAINQYSKNNTFELDLTGHPESYADLNITAAQLSNAGLWHSPWLSEFRPWYWPVLPALVEKVDERVNFVREHLDKSVLGALGFDAELVRVFPRAVEAFLGGRKGEAEKVTFRQFVMSSGNGLKPKDKAGDDPDGEGRICRIAAARVSRWLEDMVLSGQEILVDAPHLVARHPVFLRGRSTKSLQALNKTAQIPSGDVADERLGIDASILKDFMLNPIWTSRPVWLWPKIVARGDSFGSSPQSTPDFVFCEDTSSFVQRQDARSFVANVESAYVRRYVSKGVKNVLYRPEVRFSL